VALPGAKDFKQKPVVISLGGSMMFDDKGRVDRAYIRRFVSMLSGLKRKGEAPSVIVGGGAVAKEFCEAVRELTGNEFFADRIGIASTRLNALLLIIALGNDAYPKVVLDPDEGFHALQAGLIPVGAGMLEGMTTDADAVLLAQRLNAIRLINVSKVSGVYSADPVKNPKAKKFSSMTHVQLTSLAAALDSRKARTNFVFDLVASKLAQRSNLELHFVDGRKIEEIEKAFVGARHSGTVVKD
jgi:uridylate kinase